MFDHRRKLVFVHIQKTGGKSVRKAIGIPGSTIHLPARNLKTELGSERWSQYFKFAVVRNPWDRLVSAYHYRRNGGNRTAEDRRRASEYPDSFSEFLSRLDYFQNLPDEGMFQSQWDWLTDEEGNLLVDRVLRFDFLDTQIPELAEELGLGNVRVPHLNRSRHQHYSTYYNTAQQQLVAQTYSTEIQAFGFQFEHGTRNTSWSSPFPWPIFKAWPGRRFRQR